MPIPGFNQQAQIENHRVLFNHRNIDLYWYQTLPSSGYSAFEHELQVSLYPDFRSFVYHAFLGQVATVSFSDNGANDAKRYWRWRTLQFDDVTVIENWSEVASYWLDTNAAVDIYVQRGDWVLFDPDNVTDLYKLDLPPIYTIDANNLYRFNARNLRGDLHVELLTVKDSIALTFQGNQYIAHAQINEFRRFHNTRRTFFLATNKNGIYKPAYYFQDGIYSRPAPHIWKVEFFKEPNFSMIAAGRPDLLRGIAQLTEV